LIITKTPMRISLGGGGTDLPEFYQKHGGFWIAGAIDKFVYVAIKDRFEPEIRLSYSQLELVGDIDEIKHPIIREALNLFNIYNHVEIVTFADLPSRTGLGSSGAFTVGLLNALSVYKREPVENLAELAYHIEREILKRPVGKQDQYAAMVGGLNIFYTSNGEVRYRRLPTPSAQLDQRFLIYYTGIRRSSLPLLKTVRKSEEQLLEIKRLGEDAADALIDEDWRTYGELMHQHWEAKKTISPHMTNDMIDRWYSIARDAGALGGKIVGAGGGGFLLLFCPDAKVKDEVALALYRHGLCPVPFRFYGRGSGVIEI